MSKAASGAPAGGEVVKTGREVDTIVQSLLRHAADPDEGVRAQVSFAVHDLGLAEPLLAVSSLVVFLARNGKLEQGHRVALLRMLAQLLETQTAREAVAASQQHGASAQNQLVSHAVKYCSREMTQAADSVTDISVPCSQCLVLLANVNCSLVVDELLSLMPAGALPNYYLVKTLADVAAAEPVAFVSKLKEVMARMTPVIGSIKKSPMKWVFATAYGRFSESMGHYLASHAEAGTEATVTSASFEIHMASAFDVLFGSWLPTAEDAKVRFACLECLGQMCLLLDRPALEARLPKLVPAYLAQFKKEKSTDHLPIVHGLCSTLQEAVKTTSLTASINNQPPLLTLVMQTLHPMVSRPVDFTVPVTGKVHAGLLRCFEILARYDMEAVLHFVIGRFQLKERETRLASLLILRHFVNALDDILEDKKPTLMAAVLTLLGEQDLLLRKTLLQLIVSMANQQYLTLEGGQNIIKFILQQCAMNIEGEDREGRVMAGSPPAGSPLSNGGKNEATPLQIRNAGNHILGVMAAKVPSSHRVLWPYLVELVVEPEFNRAAPVIFKVLEHVASVKRAEEHPDFLINWEAAVNMPSPQALLARIMVLACEPLRHRGEQGLIMCRAMGALGPLIHPLIGKYFDESAPSLVAHLEAHPASAAAGSPEALNVSKWQDTLLKLYRETISLVADSAKWMQDLATAMGEQFKLYKGDSAMLRCVQRFLGATLARVENRNALQAGLDLMLNTVAHDKDPERQGCAQGMGLVASVHLDVVLPKLTERLAPKVPEKPKSSGFFSFGGGDAKPQGPDDKTAATIALCYGYVAAYANPELIVSRLDVHILHNILPLMPKARSPQSSVVLRVHLIKAVDLIGKAVHSSRLPDNKKNWKMAQRDELLTGLIGFLDEKPQPKPPAPAGSPPAKEGPVGAKPTLEVRLLGVNAAATLANLEPPIPQALRQRLTDAVFPFYGLNALGEIVAADGDRPSGNAASKQSSADKPGSSPTAKENLASSVSINVDGTFETGESMLESLMANMHTLLSSLISMEATVPSLVDLMRLLEPWTRSSRTVERERACQALLTVLKKFVSKCVHEKVSMAPATTVPELGAFLAAILTRCNDSSLLVRQAATENAQALLYIAQVLANPDNPKPAQEIKLITDIRNRLVEVPEGDSPSASAFSGADERLVILRDLCSLLTAVVSVNDLMALQEALLAKGVLDRDLAAAQGAALIFKTILFSKASEMTLSVRTMVTGILAALKALRVGEVVEILQAALRILTRCHFSLVVTQLLEATVPLPREVEDAITALVETGPADPSQVPVRAVGMEPEWDPVLADKVVLHFIHVLNETPVLNDKPTPVLQCATAAISAMMSVPSMRAMVDTHWAAILCTLLMRVGTSSGIGGDKNASTIDATGAVRAFLQAAQDDALLKKLDEARVWPVLEQANHYDDGMTTVTRAISEVHPTRKRALLAYLSKYFSQQSYTGQRIVATAMLAEFTNHAGEDLPFLREVIRFMLPRVADKINKVRKQALRGLGHLVRVWNDETIAMAPSVLSSLKAASEDADADVAAEAVSSLTRLAGVVSEALIGPMLISICFRLRPAFDRKEEKVRAGAFTLFGALARFGAPDNAMDDGVRGNFIDQVHASVPIFTVHANDAVEAVRLATVAAFRLLAPLLGAEFVPVLEEATGEPYNYDELVQRLCPLLNTHHSERLRLYVDNTTSYFGAPSTAIRGNAAFLAGVLVATAQPEQRRTISLGALTSEIIKLLDDSQAQVRSRAAKALSLLHAI